MAHRDSRSWKSPMPIPNLQRRPLRLGRSRPPAGLGLPSSDGHAVSDLNWAARYAVSIIAAGLCAGLHVLLGESISKTPFLIYMPAIVAAGIYGGFGPGLLATVLCEVASLAIALPHPFWTNIVSGRMEVPAVLFAAVGSIISYFTFVL